MLNSSALRRNLFDDITQWRTHPVLPYQLWLSQQKFKVSTQEVYLAMFSRFCQWLSTEGKQIDRCDSSDILKFLNSHNANLPLTRQNTQTSRQRQQYIRLLERVFNHLSEIGVPTNNPARQASIDGVDRGKDQPTRFLTQSERERVIQSLAKKLEGLEFRMSCVEAWQEYRDIALVAVFLGAGLKVGNIRCLTLNCIDLTEKTIQLSQTNYTHRARILSFAQPCISAWLSIQKQLHHHQPSKSHPVFEADRTKGFGRHTGSPHMHPSGIHRRVRKFLGDLGISGERASSQTLRNSYAAILIDHGASDNELVDFLGLHATVTAQRLRTNYAFSIAHQNASPSLTD